MPVRYQYGWRRSCRPDKGLLSFLSLIGVNDTGQNVRTFTFFAVWIFEYENSDQRGNKLSTDTQSNLIEDKVIGESKCGKAFGESVDRGFVGQGFYGLPNCLSYYLR